MGEMIKMNDLPKTSPEIDKTDTTVGTKSRRPSPRDVMPEKDWSDYRGILIVVEQRNGIAKKFHGNYLARDVALLIN